MRTQKKNRRWYDPDEFYLARRRAGLTRQKAADMLDVTTRTLRNWENGTSKIPYAAFRLMRLFGGHSLIGKQWEGWNIWQDTLWTPAGRGFQADELLYIGSRLWMARQWLAERQAGASASPNHSGITAAAGKASIGSPASRVPRPMADSGPCHDTSGGSLEAACLQEKVIADLPLCINANLGGGFEAEKPPEFGVIDDLELEVI